MNTKLYICGAVLAAAGNAFAGEFPYVAPKYCQDSVVTRPEGASGFYRSESCNTIFILPPAAGSLDYTINLSGANDEDCNELATLRADHRSLNEKVKSVRELSMKPDVSEEKLRTYEKQIEIGQRGLDRLNTSIKYLAGLEGATMAVRMASNLSEEVNRFQFLNQLLFAKGTRFEAVPVAESYVSFDAGSTETAATRPAVIRTNIPGVEVRGIQSAPASDSRIMNGAVSGKVILGMNAVCNMREQQKVTSLTKINFAPAQMEAFVPANLTYTVPVLSSYSYKAELNYEVAIEQLFHQIETRTQFTVNGFKNLLAGMVGSKDLQWEFTAYELQNQGVTAADLKEIEERERDAVLAGWARDIADHLVKMGILEKMAPTPLPAPAPGTEAETFYRQVCESKRFLGIRYSHNCWDEPYQVLRNRAGEADNVIHELKGMNLSFKESVKYSQPIYRTHTSTFRYHPAIH